MKKFGITSLAVLSLVLAGCGEAGTYKPYSAKLGDTTYKCGEKGPENAVAAGIFKSFCESDKITLKSNGKGSSGGQSFFWKVKKGKVYLKENKKDEWEETTYTYKSGKITSSMEAAGVKYELVYKK